VVPPTAASGVPGETPSAQPAPTTALSQAGTGSASSVHDGTQRPATPLGSPGQRDQRDATAAPTPQPAVAVVVPVAAAVPGSPNDERAPKVAEPGASGAAGVVPAAPAQGVQLATSAAPVAAPAPPAAANAPTFTAQLVKPLFTLASGPAGDHVVTVKVTPENLGPVTVRAHIGAEGVRMELFAPTDAGREALRSILTDLRRDLASQGATANLDLSSQNQPTDSGDRGAREGAPALPDRQASSAVEPEVATGRRVFSAASSLDVLA
jgi:flagellar hook-length control protein FliK